MYFAVKYIKLKKIVTTYTKIRRYESEMRRKASKNIGREIDMYPDTYKCTRYMYESVMIPMYL